MATRNLDAIRQRAHQALLQQAHERAQRTAHGLAQQFRGQGAHSNFMRPLPNQHQDTQGNTNRPADLQHALGNDAQAAQLWEQHHPGAVSRGQIPGWVGNQMAQQLQAVTGAEQPHMFQPSFVTGEGYHPGPQPAPGGAPVPIPSGQPHGFGPGGAVGGGAPTPQPLLPPQRTRNPNFASAHFGEHMQPSPMTEALHHIGAPGGFIHLGQGLFLHPQTGEIHGFGPVAQMANAGAPAPTPPPFQAA